MIPSSAPLCMLLSAIGFALMGACVKLAGMRGFPIMEIIAARSLVSLCLSYLDVRRKGVSLWGERRLLLFSRGLVGTAALICVYYAVTHLPFAEATVLQYLHPMFTGLLAFWVLRESLARSTLVSIGISLVGLVVMVRPEALWGSSAAYYDNLALAAALMGALGSAVAYVLVRKLSATEDASVIIFYFPLVALPLAILFPGPEFIWPQGEDWLLLLAIGVFTQIGQLGLTWAMRRETAGKSTAYSYLQVVFAAVIGWLVFSEVPDAWVIAGSGLILLAAWVNLRGQRH